MQTIDTLLFDLDGTLVDSNELILDTLVKTFEIHFPKLSFSRIELIQMMGPPLSETFGKHTEDLALIETMIQTYRTVYKSQEFDYITIYPHVIDALKRFKAAGFHIGIVTTKFKVSAMPSIRHFGIDQYIDVVIGLDDVINHKPHPEPIYKALDQFSHQGAVMIGDSPADLLAGINANILTCGVDWSYKKHELLALKPDFWLKDFADLFEMISKYNYS